MLHLPPPVHGVALKHQRMVDGRVGDVLDLRVIRYRFARDLRELGRPSWRKLLQGVVYLVRQVRALMSGRIDAGYMTLTTSGGGLLRDAVYLHVFHRFHVPCVVHVPTRGLDAELDGLRRWRRRLVASAVDRAAAVVALNDLHASELERVAPGRVVVIRNALPDVSAELVADRPSGSIILFLSNLYVEKGTLDLLDALPTVFDAVPGARMVFAGAWPDDAHRDAFGKRAAAVGVADRVEVLGPVLGPAKLDLIRGARVLVLPSSYAGECSPNVLVEAMRQGIPVVATAHSGIPELVEHGVTGLLVARNDPHLLARSLIRVLRDDAEAERLGRAGRARYERLHRQERWDEEVIDLIETAARGGGGEGSPERSATKEMAGRP